MPTTDAWDAYRDHINQKIDGLETGLQLALTRNSDTLEERLAEFNQRLAKAEQGPVLSPPTTDSHLLDTNSKHSADLHSRLAAHTAKIQAIVDELANRLSNEASTTGRQLDEKIAQLHTLHGRNETRLEKHIVNEHGKDIGDLRHKLADLEMTMSNLEITTTARFTTTDTAFHNHQDHHHTANITDLRDLLTAFRANITPPSPAPPHPTAPTDYPTSAELQTVLTALVMGIERIEQHLNLGPIDRS